MCLLALLVYPVINPWQPYSQGVMLLGFLLAIQASSWNIISGYAGYISLGHSMFLGLGLLHRRDHSRCRSGVNPLWLAPLGGVTAVLVALADRLRRAANTGPRLRHHHHRDAAGGADHRRQLQGA